MRFRSLLFAGLCAIVAAVGVRADQDPATADANAMAKKLATIMQRGEAPPKAARPLRTTFTDREVNAYFKANSKDLLPEGVKDAVVSIDDGGQVRAQALVRLDEALQTSKRSWYDPAAYLSGNVIVVATGRLQAAGGKGTFTLESASLGSLPVPTSLILQLVNYYTRTPETPQGFDLDKPFALPAAIQAVETQRGVATIVQ